MSAAARVRWLLLLVSACGAAKAPTTQVAPATPDATPADPPLELLELRAERACACADDACRIATRDALHDLDGVHVERSDRRIAAQAALGRCLRSVLDDALLAAGDALAPFRDQACAGIDVSASVLAWEDAADTVTAVVLETNILLADLLTEITQCIQDQ